MVAEPRATAGGPESRPDVTAGRRRAENKLAESIATGNTLPAKAEIGKKDVPMLITNVKAPGSSGTTRVPVRNGATMATLHKGKRGDNNRVTMLKPQLGHTESDEASTGLAQNVNVESMVKHVGPHVNVESTVQQQLIQVEREIGIVAKITGAEHIMAEKQEEKARLLLLLASSSDSQR